MLYQFLAFSAIVPSLLIIWYFYSRDLNREPAKVLWAVFGLGVASVVPVLAIAMPIAWLAKDAFQSAYLTGLFEAFFEAAIPEEFCKWLVVYLYASRHREFDEPMDGIVYGAVASLGFATLENIMYTMGGGISVAVMRAVTAVPLHAFCGAVMGYYVGQAKFGAVGKSRGSLLFQAWFWPMLMHGIYDFPLLALKRANEQGGMSSEQGGIMAALLALTLGALIVLWIWAIRLTRRLRREQLAAMAAAAAANPTQGAYQQPAASYPQQQYPQQQYPQQQYPQQQYPRQAQQAAYPMQYYAQPPPAYSRPYYPQAAAAPQGNPSMGWLWLVLGGLSASGGGLMSLGLVAAFAMNKVESGEVFNTIMGGMIIGVAPLALGVFLFWLGLKKLRGG